MRKDLRGHWRLVNRDQFPKGTIAALISPMPLSVASMLNWAAAFLVSWMSMRIPRELRYCFVAGERGDIEGPNPSISISILKSQRASQRS